MNKYFLYARKSSETEDRQILSIEQQLIEVREFAKKEKLSIINELTESMPVKKSGRPAFVYNNFCSAWRCLSNYVRTFAKNNYMQ